MRYKVFYKFFHVARPFIFLYSLFGDSWKKSEFIFEAILSNPMPCSGQPHILCEKKEPFFFIHDLKNLSLCAKFYYVSKKNGS